MSVPYAPIRTSSRSPNSEPYTHIEVYLELNGQDSTPTMKLAELPMETGRLHRPSVDDINPALPIRRNMPHIP